MGSGISGLIFEADKGTSSPIRIHPIPPNSRGTLGKATCYTDSYMKYQLETIPVTDAWTSRPPCPFCTLMDDAEKRHVEYYLGNSVMNPETRVLVNKTGFCGRHFPLMREAGHAHHLGLVAHTRLQTVRSTLSGSLHSMAKAGTAKSTKAFAEKIRSILDDCLICRSLKKDEERYAYTTVVLFGKEPEFRRLFEEGRGPCLPHAAILAEMAAKALNKKEAGNFLTALAAHLETTLGELETDVLKFTQKFDAQNDSMEWGNARDAHARTVQMLSGRTVRLTD